MYSNPTNSINEHEVITHNRIKYMRYEVLNINFCHTHTHSDFELLYVLDENLFVSSESETFQLKPGEMALFNPNTPHSCYSGTAGCQLLLLQIDPVFCYEYYPEIKNLRFTHSNICLEMPEHALHVLQETIFNIGYHYFGQLPGFEFRCFSDLNRIFSCLISFLPYTILTNDEVLANQSRKYRMNKILDYLHNHYTEKIMLKTIAEDIGLNASYLSHFFKINFNQSFQDYVNSLRLEHATYLLSKTNMRLIDICIESGFSDPKYFNKAFYNIYQMLPNDFRKLHQQDLTNEQQVFNQEYSNKTFSTNIRHQYSLPYKQALETLRKYHIFDCDTKDSYPYKL